MATPIAICGMEQATPAGIATGNNTNKYFDRTAGTVVTNFDVTSGAARTGNAGLLLTASAGTAHCGFANNGNGGILGAAGTVVASFWFRYPSLPGANAVIWQDIGTAGGNDAFLRFVSGTNIVRGEFGATTVNGPAIVANTWYHADVLVVHDANPHVMKWRINSAEQADVKLAVASENVFVMGWGNDSGTQTSTLHVDDIVVSLTAADYPLGPHKVVQLIPDVNATAGQIGTADVMGRMQNNTTVDATFNSADILNAIDEVPPLLGGTASGVGQDTISTTSAAEIPMTHYQLATEKITGCRVEVCTWANSATAAANTMGVRAFNGLAETTLFAAAAYGGVNTTTPAWICKMYAGVTNQQTLQNFTVRIGYSGDVTPLPGAHTIYAELAVKTDDVAYPATARHPGVTPARSQRFQISQDDWLSRQVPAATGPSASGNALAEQRSSTVATVTKTGTGAASSAQRSSVVATGFKSVSAPAQESQRSSAAATGTKATTGATQEQQRSAVRAVSAKGGIGAAQVQQRSADATTIRKGGTGTAAATARPLDQAAGTKAATGATPVQQRSATGATEVTGRPGVSEQRSAVVATGAKGGVSSPAVTCRTSTANAGNRTGAGAGTLTQRSTGAAAGRRSGAGAGFVSQRTTGTSTGRRGSTGGGRIETRPVTTPVSRKAALGVATVQQRTHSLNVQFGVLTDLRIRISGREPPSTITGREPPAAATGRETTTGISGREPPTSYAGRESSTTLAGREEGTP